MDVGIFRGALPMVHIWPARRHNYTLWNLRRSQTAATATVGYARLPFHWSIRLIVSRAANRTIGAAYPSKRAYATVRKHSERGFVRGKVQPTEPVLPGPLSTRTVFMGACKMMRSQRQPACYTVRESTAVLTFVCIKPKDARTVHAATLLSAQTS